MKSDQSQVQIVSSHWYLHEEKFQLVNNILYQNFTDNFTSFLVCRNPLDKLLSLYKFLCNKFGNMLANRKKSRKSKMNRNWNEFTTAVINNSTLPSWHQFLEMVVANKKVKIANTISCIFANIILLNEVSTEGWPFNYTHWIMWLLHCKL